MEALPRVHSVSIICSSSFASFGPAISSPTNVCITTTCVVLCQIFFLSNDSVDENEEHSPFSLPISTARCDICHSFPRANWTRLTCFPGSLRAGVTYRGLPMYGRSYLCLLAISVLILPPAVLRGQSRRDQAEFVRALPPRAVLPPAREPYRHPSPVTQPLPIGLPPIARAAGTIFSGTVKAIARHP